MASKPFRFLHLPAEIREHVYRELLCTANNRQDLGEGNYRYRFDFSLFRANRQICYEARKVFRQENVFVRIETPWAEAAHHIAVEGQVPILIEGNKADRFEHHHLAVVIDTTQFQSLDNESRRLVIMADDLPTFCKMWFYSDLSHPFLNGHLDLLLHIRNPYSTPLEQGSVPKALQQKLLEPFGMVKGLNSVEVQGEHYASIEKSMRDAMAVPHTSPEECIETATKLKDTGNAALAKGNCHEALDLYNRAFAAIHVVCNGRRRHIWADAFFEKELEGGAYNGKHGQIMRLLLRVRLVANTVQAYLKLEDYEEARFWGMRSINLMRQATGADDEDDEPMLDFVAANEMGKIYYRTAIACRELDDTSEARKLLRVARLYLPQDQKVQEALASVALRLG